MDAEIKSLVKRAKAFSKESGFALSTISRMILNDGKRLGELESGDSRIWPDTLKKANDELDKAEADYRKDKAS